MKNYRYLPVLAFAVMSLCQFIALPSLKAQDLAQSAESELGEIYRLQKGDSISMNIYGESDMDMSVKIGKSGSISFPLIGAVYLPGHTVPELEQKLRALYMKDYYQDPKVRVIITGYHSKYFHVSGAVEQPGRHAYPEAGTINLGQAVARCGGVDQDGDITAVTVFKHKIAGFKTYDLAKQGNVELSAGDTVVVPRLPSRNISYVATVSGEVKRPGNINLGAVGKLDIITALAQAGGFSQIANQKEGIIQRKTAGGLYRTEEVRLKDVRNGKIPMVFINEGDILIIKESRW